MHRTTIKTTAELRKFGMVMALPFGLIGGYLWWRDRPSAPWFLGIAAAFLLLGFVAPAVLRPIERWWMALAVRISVVTTFIILTISYFLVITPIALVVRLLGRDRIDLRPDAKLASYWVRAEPDGPATRPDKPY